MAKNKAKGVWENGQIIKKKKKTNTIDKKEGTDYSRIFTNAHFKKYITLSILASER